MGLNMVKPQRVYTNIQSQIGLNTIHINCRCYTIHEVKIKKTKIDA